MEWIAVEFACRERGSNRLRDNNGGILLRYCVECPALALGRCVRASPDKIKSDLDEALAQRDGRAERPALRPRHSKACTRCRKAPAAPGRTRCQKCLDDGRRYSRKSLSISRRRGRVCAWPGGCDKVVQNTSTYCRSHASTLREKKLRITRLKRGG